MSMNVREQRISRICMAVLLMAIIIGGVKVLGIVV